MTNLDLHDSTPAATGCPSAAADHKEFTYLREVVALAKAELESHADYDTHAINMALAILEGEPNALFLARGRRRYLAKAAARG